MKRSKHCIRTEKIIFFTNMWDCDTVRSITISIENKKAIERNVPIVESLLQPYKVDYKKVVTYVDVYVHKRLVPVTAKMPSNLSTCNGCDTSA